MPAGSEAVLYQVAATLVAASLMDRGGRRPLLLISHAGMCVCLAVLSLAFVIPGPPAPLHKTPPPSFLTAVIPRSTSCMGMPGPVNNCLQLVMRCLNRCWACWLMH